MFPSAFADLSIVVAIRRGEDIGLEVRRIHRPAEDVGGLPEMGGKLVDRNTVAHVCIKSSPAGMHSIIALKITGIRIL